MAPAAAAEVAAAAAAAAAAAEAERLRLEALLRAEQLLLAEARERAAAQEAAWELERAELKRLAAEAAKRASPYDNPVEEATKQSSLALLRALVTDDRLVTKDARRLSNAAGSAGSLPGPRRAESTTAASRRSSTVRRSTRPRPRGCPRRTHPRARPRTHARTHARTRTHHARTRAHTLHARTEFRSPQFSSPQPASVSGWSTPHSSLWSTPRAHLAKAWSAPHLGGGGTSSPRATLSPEYLPALGRAVHLAHRLSRPPSPQAESSIREEESEGEAAPIRSD